MAGISAAVMLSMMLCISLAACGQPAEKSETTDIAGAPGEGAEKLGIEVLIKESVKEDSSSQAGYGAADSRGLYHLYMPPATDTENMRSWLQSSTLRLHPSRFP